ncbi:MAG: hypothetical protein IJD04_07295 [Desulfovibrionaceae bacterium]|nr:hypothetical protein [Desulfovibrionaceae bacterium]
MRPATGFPHICIQCGRPPFSGLSALFLLLALLLLGGCGYTLASEEPSVIGNGEKTVKIKRVENPTLFPWLSHLMRTSLHDEVNYRKLGRWIDSGEADYELDVEVTRFEINDYGYSREGASVMYSAAMVMVLTVYDGSTNRQVWSSGGVGLSRVYDTDNAQTATRELSRELIRRCLDRMRNVF